MAPLAAMMAETPQMEEPIANRLVSFSERPKRRPIQVIDTIEKASTKDVKMRVVAPRRKTSPSKNRTPSKTMPSFSQNSYVSTPGRKIEDKPIKLLTISP